MAFENLWWPVMTFDMVMMLMGWPYASFDCLLYVYLSFCQLSMYIDMKKINAHFICLLGRKPA